MFLAQFFWDSAIGQQLNSLDSAKVFKEVSLDVKLQNKVDSVETIESKIQQSVDSLNSKLEVAHYLTRLDSIKGKLTGRIDSLSALPNPNRLRIKQLDSLRGSIDSLKQKVLQLPPGVKHTQESISKLQASISEKTNKIGSAVNEKLSLFNKNGATGLPGDLKLPSSSGLALPRGNLNLSSGKNLDLSLPQSSLPGLDVKGPEMPDNLLQDLSLPSLDKPDLSGIKGMDELKDLSGKAGDIGKTTGEIGGYANKLKDPESMGKELETKAAGMDELKGLQGNMDKISEIKDWKSDPDYLKEVGFKKAKEQVTDHFAGHDKELLAAMDQLSKVKAKFKDADGIIDMFKKRPNSLKDKPFIERIVPGINLQVQASSTTWIDFNPYAGYRISPKFTGGMGWNERLSVNFKKKMFVPIDHIYGPRMYLDFKFKESLTLKAETEWMNTLIKTSFPAYPVEVDGRGWVWTSFAGIKNTFNFSKKVKGHVQVMYNLYNPEKRSPYANRINVRFGFEFPMKKGK